MDCELVHGNDVGVVSRKLAWPKISRGLFSLDGNSILVSMMTRSVGAVHDLPQLYVKGGEWVRVVP